MKEYCVQNNGDCQTCSLVNYGRDCMNKPVTYENRTVVVGENGAFLWRVETETTTYFQIEGETGELLEPMDDSISEEEAIKIFKGEA